MTARAQHTLYRFFDQRGHLLYVGRTINPGRRWREHEKTKAWFGEVAAVTREVFATAEAVDQAERQAIADESPLHNIALTGRRLHQTETLLPPPPPRPLFVGGAARSVERRLHSAGEDLPTECEGDETFCECASCHARRLNELDNLREEYGWHPTILATIDAAERDYFGGAWLSDWYYDLTDIRVFTHLSLVEQSRDYPLPALVHFEGLAAVAGCPFCLNLHEHFVPPGTALNRPVEAGCTPDLGGRYFLVPDMDRLYDLLDEWAQASIARQGRAA